MTPADERLKALFSADEPPARDLVFEAALMERLVRRRCLQDLGFLAALSVLGAVALWALWPALEPALKVMSGQLAPAAIALALALSAAGVAGVQLGQATAMES